MKKLILNLSVHFEFKIGYYTYEFVWYPQISYNTKESETVKARGLSIGWFGHAIIFSVFTPKKVDNQ